MKISGAFPSDYLKAADLQDKQIRVTMSHVDMKDIGDDHKPILYFVGKDKGLVLNKTNANNISALYGDDTDDWRGKDVVLYPTWVDFQGRSVQAIRVRPPGRNDEKKADPNITTGNGAMRAAQAATAASQHFNEINPPPLGKPDRVDDDIPF